MSRPRYSIIPGDALTDSNVKDGHLRVLAVLGTHTDKNGWCKVNQKSIAERVGKSRETVNRIIKDLCDLGYVRKVDGWSKAEGRSISRYQVLMDRPDRSQDIDAPCDTGVTAPVMSGDHNPCDVQTSQLNDPSFNDHSSLRSGGARDRFDEFEDAYPKPMGSDRAKARKSFLALSEAERATAIAGAEALKAEREIDRKSRGESLERSQRFTPNASRWLADRSWESSVPAPVDAEPLVSIKQGTPEFEAVESLRRRPIQVGMSRKVTVKQSELDAALAAERQTA